MCPLAPLLIRIAETTRHATWPALRRELDRFAIGTFTSPAGRFRQRIKPQRDILAQLKIEPSLPILELTPTEPVD